jgi:OOP family OmpA-OmpF porin
MNKCVLAITLFAAASSAYAEKQFSASIVLGKSDQETSISGFESVSGDDTSFGVRGDYSINDNIAIEAGYFNYGEMSDTFVDSFGDTINDKIETTAINVGVKASFPLNNQISVNGRLGLSMWDYELAETDSAFPGEVFKLDDDGTDIYYGIGMEFNVSEALFIGVEYTITDMDVSLLNVIKVDHEVSNFAVSLGAKF